MPSLPESLFTPEGELLPMRLELHEASGPVSPRFQYDLWLCVETNRERATLRYRRRGKPRDLEFEVEPGRAELAALWSELVATRALEASADLIGDRRGRVGVSFNLCELQIGAEPPVRIEYLPSLLADREPASAPLRALLATLKAFAERQHDAGR